METTFAPIVNSDGTCSGSGAEQELSIAESERREFRCRACGRFVRIRPRRPAGGWPSAIIPRHRPQAAR